jgi:hypothetical protein
LKHFGCGPNNESVLGDLAEQYRQKGRMWFWRQSLKGIAVSMATQILGHKAIAARAIAAGCIAWTLFVVFVYPAFTTSFFGGNSLGVDVQALHPIGSAWSVLWAPAGLSFGPNPSNPLVFLLWIQLALPFLAWTLIGWLVTRVDIGPAPKESNEHLIVRVHRDLAPLFAGFVFLLHLVLVVPYVNFLGLGTARFLIGPITINALIAVLGILLGGSLRRSRQETDSRPEAIG